MNYCEVFDRSHIRKVLFCQHTTLYRSSWRKQTNLEDIPSKNNGGSDKQTTLYLSKVSSMGTNHLDMHKNVE